MRYVKSDGGFDNHPQKSKNLPLEAKNTLKNENRRFRLIKSLRV